MAAKIIVHLLAKALFRIPSRVLRHPLIAINELWIQFGPRRALPTPVGNLSNEWVVFPFGSWLQPEHSLFCLADARPECLGIGKIL
jgi:hypothetical protein